MIDLIWCHFILVVYLHLRSYATPHTTPPPLPRIYYRCRHHTHLPRYCLCGAFTFSAFSFTARAVHATYTHTATVWFAPTGCYTAHALRRPHLFTATLPYWFARIYLRTHAHLLHLLPHACTFTCPTHFPFTALRTALHYRTHLRYLTGLPFHLYRRIVHPSIVYLHTAVLRRFGVNGVHYLLVLPLVHCTLVTATTAYHALPALPAPHAPRACSSSTCTIPACHCLPTFHHRAALPPATHYPTVLLPCYTGSYACLVTSTGCSVSFLYTTPRVTPRSLCCMPSYKTSAHGGGHATLVRLPLPVRVALARRAGVCNHLPTMPLLPLPVLRPYTCRASVPRIPHYTHVSVPRIYSMPFTTRGLPWLVDGCCYLPSPTARVPTFVTFVWVDASVCSVRLFRLPLRLLDLRCHLNPVQFGLLPHAHTRTFYATYLLPHHTFSWLQHFPTRPLPHARC